MELTRSSSPEVRWGRMLGALIREQRDSISSSYQATTPAITVDFEAFFRRYEPRITGYLWRMVADEGAACDLCQETFIRAWQHFAEVQAAQQPQAWLFRVATNLALNHVRARARGVRAAVPLDAADDPASSDPSVRFVEHDFVQGILTELSPKARALLILRDVYQVSFDEVSALLGLSPTAARMALSRARAQFRDRYLQKERA